MKMQDFIDGLKIIQAAKPKNESDWHGRAEHDMFWAGSLKWIGKEDRKRLKDLGWDIDKDCDGFSAMF
jgi:hypothetical protein